MLYFELYNLFSFTCKYKLGQLWCKLEHSLKSSLDIFDFYFISGSFSASPVSLGTTTNRINLSCFFSFFMFGNVISYKTHYICSSSIIQILCTCSIKNIILLNFILIIICALLIFLVQVHGLNKVVYNCIYYFWWCHQAITT